MSTVRKIESLQRDRLGVAGQMKLWAARLDDDNNLPSDMNAWQSNFDELSEKFDRLTGEIDTAKLELMRNRNTADELERIDNPDHQGARVSDPDHDRKPGMVYATARKTRATNFINETIGGYDADQRAHRFGMYALALASRQMPGRFQFAEATKFADGNFPMNVLKTNDGSGHYLVPEEFGVDLINLRERYGVVRRLFKNRRMTSDTRTDPRRVGGLTAHFLEEGAAGTESDKEWDNVRLTAKDLMVLSRYTSQLNMDSVIDIGNDLAGEISHAFAQKEDDCGFNGTGTSTYGGITGARQKLQTAAGNPTTTSAGGVIVGSGNAYGELTMNDFTSVVGVLPQYAADAGAVWVAHRVFYYEVMERLALASGGVSAREVREGGGGRPIFIGHPVEFSQVMPSTAANSQLCCLFGSFQQGASFGDRQQDSIMFSEHANIGGQSLFERNEIGVRGTERFDINVHDVGTASTAGPIVGLQTLNA